MITNENIVHCYRAGRTQRPVCLDSAVDAALSNTSAGTYAERLIEYAGRLCYASVDSMGKAPNFIAARIREGHEDILEHAYVSMRYFTKQPLDILAIMQASPFLAVHQTLSVEHNAQYATLVSGNLRAWRQLYKTDVLLAGCALVVAVAPKVFEDILPEIAQAAVRGTENAVLWNVLAEGRQDDDAQYSVHFLGASIPDVEYRAPDEHYQAAFMFKGISRTATHQLVRHRLGSFSQESQRYVGLQKGEWEAIIPPSIRENPQALAEMTSFWEMAEEKYERLRKLGIRQEDARFLLPNAASTKIVTSMDFAGWRHYVWLRALDKAAQWEIRGFSQLVLEQLAALTPMRFTSEMDALAKVRVERGR